MGAVSGSAFRKEGLSDVTRSKTQEVARRRRATGTSYRSRFKIDDDIIGATKEI